MITKKPLSVFGAQAPENNAPLFQPPPEVLDHPSPAPNSVVRVTVGRQIHGEAADYYVKVMPADPAAAGMICSLSAESEKSCSFTD
ncbi:MAG: hypothetical protein KJ072_25925, partial [Verrucomicrobia bacterium]|nr:hypothetical protein [Verrucomicrobiota bacterium]